MSVVIKYHNQKMLLTVDLNALFEVILGKYGEGISIQVEPMTEQERTETAENVGELIAVRDRFWILEIRSDGSIMRRTDLEHATVISGVK